MTQSKLIEEIQQLKQEKNAVILAHYYLEDDVQSIADYIGDSYYLSEIATKVPQQVIVFCGVSFMGESAKILNPEKDRAAAGPNSRLSHGPYGYRRKNIRNARPVSR